LPHEQSEEPTLSWVRGDFYFAPSFYPVVKDGKVYCENKAYRGLFIFDLESGEEIWHGKEDESVRAPPALDCEYVFFPRGISEYFRLVCFSLETKEPLWITKGPGRPTSSPLIVDDKIIIATGSRYERLDEGPVNEDYVICFDKFTGKCLWKFKTGEKMNSLPAVCQNAVVASSADGTLFALTINNGDLLWKFETGQTVSTSMSPIVYKDRIYYGCRNLYCLSTDGDLLWKIDLDPYGDISLSGGILYVRSSEGIVSIDIESKDILWTYPVDRKIMTTIVSGAGLLFFGTSEGDVCCLSREGELLWRYRITDDYFYYYVKPVLSEGYLLLVSGLNKLYAFRLPAEYCYTEAEGLAEEGKYEEAGGFYVKALEYYEEVDNKEMVEKITQKISAMDFQAEDQCTEWLEYREQEGDFRVMAIAVIAILALAALLIARKRIFG